jgi:hypothetical protein
MTTRHVWMAIAMLAVAVPASAQQRPLVTEDPETVGLKHVLVEGGLEFDHDQFYSAYGLTANTTYFPTVGVSVGIGPTAELQMDLGLFQRLQILNRREAPLSGALDFAGDRPSGMGDLVVATKLRFVPESERHPGFGVRFGVKLPTASPDKGMGLGTTDFFATALVAKTVKSVRFVGNGGLLNLGNPVDAQDSAQALGLGLSVARAITNEIEAVGEMSGHLAPFGDPVPAGLDSRAVLRLGARYTHQLLRFDVGLLIGITARDPAFGITAGATYVIGK